MNHRICALAIAAMTAGAIDTTAHAAGTSRPAGAAAQMPSTSKATLNSSDHTFLSDALAANQLDIDVSAYAAKQGGSRKVRQFAQAMASEHGRLAAEMQKANDGLVAPPAPTTQPGINLVSRQGIELDRAYIGLMATYEHDAAGKFRSAIDGAQYNKTIREMAKKVLPALERDKANAEAMERSLK